MPFSDLINATVISKMSKSEEEGSAEARAEKMVKSVWEVIYL